WKRGARLPAAGRPPRGRRRIAHCFDCVAATGFGLGFGFGLAAGSADAGLAAAGFAGATLASPEAGFAAVLAAGFAPRLAAGVAWVEAAWVPLFCARFLVSRSGADASCSSAVGLFTGPV